MKIRARELGDHGLEIAGAGLVERFAGLRGTGTDHGRTAFGQRAKISKFVQHVFKFLAGSFSAVSKPNFATKYAFDSIFQALQDLHTSAPLQSQKFSKQLV